MNPENYNDELIQQINDNLGIIHRVCNAYFYNSPDKQDVFQEIVFQLWKSYPTFQGSSKFTTWMYKIALNTAITYWKKTKRAPDNLPLGKTHEQFPVTDEENNTESKMSFLYAAINTLRAVDKGITLLYLDHYSYEEIAVLTGLSKTNVSVRLVRIKKELEQKLKNIF